MKKNSTIKEDIKKAVKAAEADDLNEAVGTDEDFAECDKAEEVVIDIATVMKKIENAEKQASENLDKYQRTLAEFDNFRKRTVKEKSSMYDDGASGIALGLLPVLDNFERAFASSSDSDKETAFYKGAELIYRQLFEYLASKGVTAIDAIGSTFNPELHEAVAHVDDPEYGEQEIVADMQKGYKYKDKVLRHSVVKVAN